MRKLITLLLALAVLLCVAGGTTQAAARDLIARVVGVQDGDTVTVRAPGAPQVRVRLVEIDAPESGQPYGRRSKQILSELVFGKTVRVREEGQDRYGRTLGRLYVGRMDVNAAMVRRGAAWVYVAYSRDPSLRPLEARARRKRVGLWGLQRDQITPPWEWRRVRREPASSSPGASSRDRVAPPFRTGSGQRCTAKTRCVQMSSCAEARFHLRQCGVGLLDGDRDGVPCEAIC